MGNPSTPACACTVPGVLVVTNGEFAGEFYAGCSDYFGMGIFYSSDGGQTFEPRNGSGDTARIYVLSLADTGQACG